MNDMTQPSYTIRLTEAVARNPQVRLAAPVNLEIKLGEHIAIAGPNGAGKSLLVDLMTGKYPLAAGRIEYIFDSWPDKTIYNNVKYITFRDTYGSSDANYYYQQRWNVHDQDEIPLVRDLLGTPSKLEQADSLLDIFRLQPLLDKRIILLSSGELRKFQIAKALLTGPFILIMDNPFIGLDANARNRLFELLDQLSLLGALQIILVVSRPDDIPPFITHVIPVENKTVQPKMTRRDYLATLPGLPPATGNELEKRIFSLPYTHEDYTSDEVINLNHVSIRYDDRTILRDLDWTVCRGERWALSGENGAGKSTLLSLVCADNPQAYACDIRLFGRRRGTGESIWDIKRHIGYVSPEMHRAYLKDLPAIDIVASGLNDSVGLYVRPKPEQKAVCEWWMDIFGIAHLKDRTFLKMSSGEQRLCLLARAFVKDPELLILDEPLHGLDDYNRQLTREIISAFCQRRNKTMVMVTHYAEELPGVITDSLFLKKNK